MRRASPNLVRASQQIAYGKAIAPRRTFGVVPQPTEVARLNKIYGFDQENDDPRLRLTFLDPNTAKIGDNIFGPTKRKLTIQESLKRMEDEPAEWDPDDEAAPARWLRSDGHRIWGMVVYRTTYSDDLAWRSCIHGLESLFKDGIGLRDEDDLLEDGRFKLTIIEDRETLDSASTQTIREHFKKWCNEKIYEEQGSPEEIEARREKDLRRCVEGLPQRYEYCVEIDEESLQSMSALGSETSSLDDMGWAKIIKRQRSPNDWMDQDDDVNQEPIEGCTIRDVGWQKVHCWRIMCDVWWYLRRADEWDRLYGRPPQIATDYW